MKHKFSCSIQGKNRNRKKKSKPMLVVLEMHVQLKGGYYISKKNVVTFILDVINRD